jgi:hypothetical protein
VPTHYGNTVCDIIRRPFCIEDLKDFLRRYLPL